MKLRCFLFLTCYCSPLVHDLCVVLLFVYFLSMLVLSIYYFKIKNIYVYGLALSFSLSLGLSACFFSPCHTPCLGGLLYLFYMLTKVVYRALQQ